VRSALDPTPRSISVKSLALLVAMLLSGVGISVHEFLDSRHLPERSLRQDAPCIEECTRGERIAPDHPTARDPSAAAPLQGATGSLWIEATPRDPESTSVPAPTQWVPELDERAQGPVGRSAGTSTEH
jgi:hypothetical protein